MAEFFAAHEGLPGWQTFVREWVVARIQANRAYVNAATLLRLGSDAEECLDELIASFRTAHKGAGFWLTAASTPPNLPALLKVRGFRLRRKFPAMHRPLTAKLTKFATDGWEITPQIPRAIPKNSIVLAATHNDRQLGSCLVSFGNEMAGLHDVEVEAKQRNRGIGTSLVLAACSLAQDHGRASIGLLATGLGENVYTRCGFHPVAIFDYWYSALTN